MFRRVKPFDLDPRVNLNPARIRQSNITTDHIGRIIDLLNSNSIENISPETAIEARLAIEDVLSKLLLRIQPKDIAQFNQKRREFLGVLLKTERKLCVMSALYVIAMIGEKIDEPYITHLAEGNGIAMSDIEVRQEAQRVLSGLRTEKDRRSLLRASSSSSLDNPQTLLRSTVDDPKNDGNKQLLMPYSGQDIRQNEGR